ncbi:MAG: nitrile hydratase subunit alpha [Burkholderiales bacterium]
MPHDPTHGHDPAPATSASPHGAASGASIALERALRELLVEKGVFDEDAIRAEIELTESRTPLLGARVVARAWTDPVYRDWLLRDAKAAIQELLGIDLELTPELVVVENTPTLHHVVCCTLCSCYPRAVIGVPPAWYKSAEYRSRIVVEPREVLLEFGLRLPPDTVIRVVDSTADIRYLVMPMRPEGTETMSEAELAALVGRDSLIGVAQARASDRR